MTKAVLKPITYGRIWQLALPLIISNLSTPLLGLVDTAVLGHLPQAQGLAAVALGASIMTFVFWSFGFLRMGTTSLSARAVGAGSLENTSPVFWRSAQLALILAVLLLAIMPWLLPLVVAVLTTPGEVAELALGYCQARLWAAPAALLNYVLIGWFIGRQNTRVPLMLMVLLNLSNIVFDLWLILGMGMGALGAAWASVAAEWLAALVGLGLVLNVLGLTSWRRVFELAPWHDYRSLVAINGHLFVRTFVLLSVLLFFNSQSASYGEQVLAANAILLQMIAVISFGLDGFAHAAEALVGQAAGARDRKLFTQACIKTGVWSFAAALLLSLVFLCLGPSLLGLFTDLPEVLEVARDHYVWMPWFPLLSVAAYHMDGVFLGWGRADVMQLGMLGSALCVFFPVWWLIPGNDGLWWAFALFNGSRGALLMGYLGAKWRDLLRPV